MADQYTYFSTMFPFQIKPPHADIIVKLSLVCLLCFLQAKTELGVKRKTALG